jgi:hypothetical protein
MFHIQWHCLAKGIDGMNKLWLWQWLLLWLVSFMIRGLYFHGKIARYSTSTRQGGSWSDSGKYGKRINEWGLWNPHIHVTTVHTAANKQTKLHLRYGHNTDLHVQCVSEHNFSLTVQIAWMIKQNVYNIHIQYSCSILGITWRTKSIISKRRWRNNKNPKAVGLQRMWTFGLQSNRLWHRVSRFRSNTVLPSSV